MGRNEQQYYMERERQRERERERAGDVSRKKWSSRRERQREDVNG